eukprot:TRINITY_DN23730_c0_g1_i1.p1 TRINITY_DN23730_c0_g1~~TRINITY_DN23730_c0_g1_i1.p1  ORF type:complete len:378 (+),score=96.07 TRINITY_DN23730_c0_g1_i1:78-1136(+)
MGVLKGAAVLLPILLSAIVGSVVVGPLAFPLLLVPGLRVVYHAWVDVMKKQWFTLVTLMLHYVGGIKLYIYGEMPLDERALILSNHRTRVDWMILWGFLLRCPGQKLRELRIVLKRELKRLPVFGWAMCGFRFIFLSRDWSKDKEVLSSLIEYYKKYNERVSMLIFPEGTDLHKSAIEKSKKYAVENNETVLDYVLYPRSTGTQFILDKMGGSFDAVWDLTMAYKDRVPGERPDEKKFAQGCFPQEVHVHLKRYPMKDFPKSSDVFPTWLKHSFLNKEKMLNHFYNNNHTFDSKRIPLVTSPVAVLSCMAYWGMALAFTIYLLNSWIGFLLVTLSLTLNILYGSRQDEVLMK